MTNKQYKKTSSSLSHGFTLIETLVAITILMIVIVGPISLIGDAVHNSYYAKDQIIAINLAQEGIEAVRWKRDSNILAGGAWDAGLGSGVDGYYIVDVQGAPPVISTPCIGACLTDLMPIYLDMTNDLYRQGTGFATTTQFSRIVRIENVSGNVDERKVTATVNWRTGGGTGTVSVSGSLFKTI